MQSTTEDLQRDLAIHAAATPGPWFVVYTDDTHRMNAVYIGTVDRGDGHDNSVGIGGDDDRSAEIVAVTLHQLMPRIDHASQLWDENAAAIAHEHNRFPIVVRELIEARATIAELELDADFLRAQVVDGTRELERLREMLRECGKECGFCQCD